MIMKKIKMWRVVTDKSIIHKRSCGRCTENLNAKSSEERIPLRDLFMLKNSAEISTIPAANISPSHMQAFALQLVWP